MRFQVLGSLEAFDGDRRLDLGAPRQRATLAVLLLHANEIVPTDRLAEELWPNELPRTAAKAIQVYVSNLRKAFGAARDALETRGSGYLLNVRPGELDRAKENLEGRLLLSLESTSNRMTRLGKATVTDTPLLEIDEVVRRLEAVTSDEVAADQPSGR